MGSYNSSTVKWRVLDDQTNTGAAGLFLLSEDCLGSGTDGGVYFQQNYHKDNGTYYKGSNHQDGTTEALANAWQGSDAQAWCNNFESSGFDSRELGAILETTKSDVEFTKDANTFFQASDNILNGDQVFFLSAQEVENVGYGFTDDAARTANYGGNACTWWLRSSGGKYTYNCGIIVSGTGTTVGWVYSSYAVRPAFNLDTSKVVFTSAAAGGKADTAGDSNLTAVGAAGSEWKLTLEDAGRSGFKASYQTTHAALLPGAVVNLNYEGAKTGANEYVSVLLADTGNEILYYGKLASNSDSGAVSLTIPSNLADGTYTLNVFSEQDNGDKRTDYASPFTNLSLIVDSANGSQGDTPIVTPNQGSHVGESHTYAEHTHNYVWQLVRRPEANTEGEEGLEQLICTECGDVSATVKISAGSAYVKRLYEQIASVKEGSTIEFTTEYWLCFTQEMIEKLREKKLTIQVTFLYQSQQYAFTLKPTDEISHLVSGEPAIFYGFLSLMSYLGGGPVNP